jgi:hypothetical protein
MSFVHGASNDTSGQPINRDHARTHLLRIAFRLSMYFAAVEIHMISLNVGADATAMAHRSRVISTKIHALISSHGQGS